MTASTRKALKSFAVENFVSEILLLSAVGGGVGVEQTDDSDLLHLNLLRVVQFDLDVLEYESPYVVAETVCVEMSLRRCISIETATDMLQRLAQIDETRAGSSETTRCRLTNTEKCALVDIDDRVLTLKLILALTFSPRICAMALSKLDMILMASWGSMRRLLMRSSKVSASVPPMLHMPFSAQCWIVVS